MQVEKVAEEALGLPMSSRALLVEQLLASLAGEIDLGVERAILNEIQERRAAVRDGKAGLVEGAEALIKVRAALEE
jgi:hypothetical protein